MRATSLCLAVLVIASLPVAAQPRQEREATTPAAELADVGKGGQLARQRLKPGAYITARHRKAVRAWLAKHQGPGQPCLPGLVRTGDACAPEAAPDWTIGIALPNAAGRSLPAGLAAALPKAPPGNSYVLLGGDILLIATASRIVVDAVPAGG